MMSYLDSETCLRNPSSEGHDALLGATFVAAPSTTITSDQARRSMRYAKSKDGTSIAFTREGFGPAIVLVGGGLVDKSENAPLATELAQSFTVYNYDRRGRGESGDTQPYALQREIEDIETLIDEAGGTAHLFGVSSGGALVLEAAAAGVPAATLAVYEVPYSLADEAVHAWNEYRNNLRAALAEGDRDKALATFMKLAGSSDEDIESARSSQYWAPMQAIAPTLAYDAEAMGIGYPPTDRLKAIAQPTLVATGSVIDPGMQGIQPNFFSHAADAIAEAVPYAERRTIANQGHQADPRELGKVLKPFFERAARRADADPAR